MLLTDRVAKGIASGTVTVAFRRWRTARVAAGSTFLSSVGVIQVGAVERVDVGSLTDREATTAGASSVAELVAGFRGADTDPVFRIELSWAGPDPRESLRDAAELTDADRTDLRRELDALDRRSADGPWTHRILRAIDANPGQRAEQLRGSTDKDVFKRRVRQLKNLGLTVSLPAGYDLSRRGAAYLALDDSDPRPE